MTTEEMMAAATAAHAAEDSVMAAAAKEGREMWLSAVASCPRSCQCCAITRLLAVDCCVLSACPQNLVAFANYLSWEARAQQELFRPAGFGLHRVPSFFACSLSFHAALPFSRWVCHAARVARPPFLEHAASTHPPPRHAA